MVTRPNIEFVQQVAGKDTITFVPGTWAHGWWEAVVKSRVIGSTPGNWGDDGQWFERDGEFVKGIGGSDFNLYVLRWSERNSVPDRRSASAVLAAHLGSLCAGQKDSKHLVVAHSHGGNIAISAFEQIDKANIPERSLHFISLGTPFIWFQRQSTSGYILELLNTLVSVAAPVISILLIAVSFVYIPAFLLHKSTKEINANSFGGGWRVALIALVSVALLGRIFRVTGKWLLKSEWNIQGILAEAPDAPKLENLKRLGSVLIIQPPADEAWFSLVIPAFAIWSIRCLTALLARTKWIAISLGVIGMVCGLGYDVLKYADWHFGWRIASLHSELSLNPIRIYEFLLVPFALLFLLGFVFAFLGTLGSLALGLIGYTFVEGLALSFGCSVHVEHYPPGGPWAQYCPKSQLSGLHHSVYSSTEVREMLSGWIKQKLEKR